MNLPGKIETAANIATLGAAVLLSVVMIKVYISPGLFARRPVARPSADATVGTSLKGRLQGVDWSRNGRTLVLALSTKCHFCSESAPFFRRLASEASKNVKIVAVLPEPVAEAEAYLNGEGVRADQVKQAPPAALGVRGTPTMLLVNSQGAVTRVWVGKLDAQAQEEAMTALLGTRALAAPSEPAPHPQSLGRVARAVGPPTE